MLCDTFLIAFVFAVSINVIKPATSNNESLQVLYQMNYLEFYETAEERQKALDSGEYIPQNIAPTDVDVYYSDDGQKTIFLSTPRQRAGLPASVATVTNKFNNGNPVLKPYPSWSWYRNLDKCRRKRILSSFRVKIDECDRLWLVDTGRLSVQKISCPPQILAFDLKTNKLVHQYEIPADQYKDNTFFVNVAVDIRNGKCDEPFIYVPDSQAIGLVVYDVKNKESWRISDESFLADPAYKTYNVQGTSFDLMDGILGISLTPYKKGEDRKLFYHAMSSASEHWVSTSDLRDKTKWVDEEEDTSQYFYTYFGSRYTQSAGEAIDKKGTMYFGLISNCTIACWNTESKYYGTDYFGIVDENVTTLQFNSGMKIVTNQKGREELWTVSNRLQKFNSGTVNLNELNIRILTRKIDEINCVPKKKC